MKAFVAGIPDRALPMLPLLQVGEPHPLIVSTAETLGVDLIVIGAHSKRSFLDVLLG
ncbi:MAG TPA: universal stress protein [Candidatus Tectomicrobia bacterium]|nr:universal stress protein [Candidatus Tectomicrobia bacterium]